MLKTQKRRKRKILWKRVALLCLVFALLVLVAAKGFSMLFGSGSDRPIDSFLPFERHISVSKLKGVETPDWVDVRLLDPDGAARSGEELKKVNGIVIHYVGNPGTTAQANRNYFNMPDTEVCSHFVVGLDGEIIQCLPLYEKSAASNNRNGDTISIEVCHPDDGGKFGAKTYASLVKLASWLCDTCGFKNEDCILRHYDITGKLCPIYYVEHEDAWRKLQKDILGA